jgi:protein arginine kinase activator
LKGSTTTNPEEDTVLCQSCQKNQANFHLTEMEKNEISKDIHLCQQCALEQGYAPGQPSNINHLLQQLIEKQQSAADQTATSGLHCPSCGMSYEDFRKNARFGCCEDYRAFGDEVREILGRIHGTTRHQGKIPQRAVQHLQAIEALKKLQAELTIAVEAEDFEGAAALRDQIQTIEARIGKLA